MNWVDYTIVAALGTFVGIGEIVSRHKERPMLALRSLPSLAYIGINVGAACGALILIDQFSWDFGMQPNDPALRTTQILVAGFGAMAFLRSSLFLVRVGDRDVGVGPGALLISMAEVADSAVKRQVRNSIVRIKGELARIALTGVDFELAVIALPTYCLALEGDRSPQDQLALRNSIDSLRHSDLQDSQKLVLLALSCVNTFGESTVLTAINAFGETMFRSAEPLTGQSTGQSPSAVGHASALIPDPTEK